jgi:membrane protease YdiL (CAAX protease family)
MSRLIKLLKRKFSSKFWTTLFILSLFYTLWTIRGWYGYLKVPVSPETQANWFLTLSKPLVWIPLIVLLTNWWFRSNVKQALGLKFNFKIFLWCLFAVFMPMTYIGLGLVLEPDSYQYTPRFTLHYFYTMIFSAAILEEFLFRGFIQTYLSKFFVNWLATLFQAILFSVIHFCWWVWAGVFSWDGALFIAVLGGFWGYVRQKSESIYPGIASHAVYDLVLGMLI